MIKERKNIDIILPCHFFASVNIYAYYLIGNIIWEKHENFQKRSIRNRCSIKTASGVKQLSIPLKSGKNQQLPIDQVEISYAENWIKDFRHSLITNYSGSPYMEYYLEEIISCLAKEKQFLWDLNKELNELIIDSLDISNVVELTSIWKKEYVNDVDLRKALPDLQIDHQYPQLFKEKGLDFIPNLSILDLLFCCGPEAKMHLDCIAKQIISKNNMF